MTREMEKSKVVTDKDGNKFVKPGGMANERLFSEKRIREMNEQLDEDAKQKK